MLHQQLLTRRPAASSVVARAVKGRTVPTASASSSSSSSFIMATKAATVLSPPTTPPSNTALVVGRVAHCSNNVGSLQCRSGGGGGLAAPSRVLLGATYARAGEPNPIHTVAKNHRKLDPKTMPHYVKAKIENDRQELGLPEVGDWDEFSESAILIPGKGGATWVGADDPRAIKIARRTAKLRKGPAQVERKAQNEDSVEELEKHPFRAYYSPAVNVNDPMSVATGLYQAGLLKSHDIKFTAAKVNYKMRDPIVSIMGHVDHGKTTLLDYLRNTNVAAAEAGGITQNVGAFSVKTENGNVTFIDTPGHAAFATMRAAGAAATDVIILVVSAVDGLQPQTKEVIELARESSIPLVVAVNKIDRQPNIEHVKKKLRDSDVELEEDGGDVQLVKVCALDGTGVDDLLEAVHLQAAICELHTPEPCRAEVTVVESNAYHGKEVAGIVKCGTLRPGQTLCCGLTYAIVRRIFDETGKKELKSAGVSTPVLLKGFKALPKPGMTLMQVSCEDHAEKFYSFMKSVYKCEGGRERFLQKLHRDSEGQFYDRKPENKVQKINGEQFNIVCKSVTFGMLQALLKMVYDLPPLPGLEVAVKVTEVGGITDFDVFNLGAAQTKGCMLMYGEGKDTNSLTIPDHNTYFRFKVLYHGLDFLKKSMVDALPKLERRVKLAKATCINVFKASKAKGGNAGGMMVNEGTLSADAFSVRVLRKKKKTLSQKKAEQQTGNIVGGGGDTDDPDSLYEVVYDGGILELRRFKEVVSEVEEGLECGVILYDDFVFRTGDIIEEYKKEFVERDVEEEFEHARKREEQMRYMQESAADISEEEEKAGRGGHNNNKNTTSSASPSAA